jgi:cobalt-zinc-cadmium efflux system outer membrane protein
MNRFLFILFICFSGLIRSQSIDTVKLDLADAEKSFVSKNLLLLASKYEIDASKALEIQAKLWENPNFYFEQAIYNNLSGRYFPTKTKYGDGSLGQNQLSVTQLISISGKINKRTKLAKISTELAQYQFYDLLRTLKYSLKTNYYSLHYNLRSYRLYNIQIESLSNTIASVKEQSAKGNISSAEYLRLVAFQNNLKTEQIEILKTIHEQNRELHTLLGDSAVTIYSPQVNIESINNINPESYNLKQLMDSAYANRSDLKVQEAQVKFENQNLSYQKSLAIPDLNLAGVYDRNGSYIPNYYGFGVGLPVSIFNRNQGNIKASKARIKEAEATSLNYKLQVQNDVIIAYESFRQVTKFYNTLDTKLTSQYEQLLDGIAGNYAKRNISLVEFLDYYESFRNNLIQLNAIQAERFNSLESLNYEIGKTLFK